MARFLVSKEPKQKRNRPCKGVNKKLQLRYWIPAFEKLYSSYDPRVECYIFIFDLKF